jgi:hypothetical protein
MSAFTLDNIRAAADAKYGSTDITVGDTVCSLLNPLRLPKEKRDELVGIQDRMNEEAGDDKLDQAEGFESAIRCVAKTEHQADVLLGAIGGDLAVLAEVFETYGKATQVGEASASAA